MSARIPGRRALRLRRTAACLAALAVAAVLGACTSEPDPEPTASTDVVVSGDFGARPTLTFDAPLTIDEPRTELVWDGDGPEIAVGSPVLVNWYAQDGRDAGVIRDTFDDFPEPYWVTPEQLGAELVDAFVGTHAGARVLQLSQDGDVPVVLVADLIAGRAAGTPVEPPEGLPTVAHEATGEPVVTVPDDDPPEELLAQTLIRGDGPQVRADQTVMVQYTALTWAGEQIDSTWSSDRSPFVTIVGDSRPIVAWDDVLIEQTVGSQVLIVAPPAVAYEGTDVPWADETIVFVVDILFAGNLEAPDTEQGSDEAGAGAAEDDDEEDSNP